MKASFSIREARVGDIPEILRQRRAMYHDMGHRDALTLDGMVATSEPYLRRAIADGSVHAWLSFTSGADPAGGGVVIVSPWLSRPHSLLCRQASILIVNTYPAHPRRV